MLFNLKETYVLTASSDKHGSRSWPSVHVTDMPLSKKDVWKSGGDKTEAFLFLNWCHRWNDSAKPLSKPDKGADKNRPAWEPAGWSQAKRFAITHNLRNFSCVASGRKPHWRHSPDGPRYAFNNNTCGVTSKRSEWRRKVPVLSQKLRQAGGGNITRTGRRFIPGPTFLFK